MSSELDLKSKRMCRPNSGRQFLAVLRKNVLLQTRSGRSFLGISGLAAFVLEILTPAAFFLLMCLPKYYFDVTPTAIPTQLFQAMDLDSPHWANKYQGTQRRSRCLCLPHLHTHAASATDICCA